MKPTHIILAAILAASSAIQAATAEHKLPAPLPEFKTPEQLAVWRKEMAEKAKAAGTVAAHSTAAPGVFYTGKPFLPESGTYGFKFRQYDPELSRWTTADPSGFPDGANLNKYAPIPSSDIDPSGLFSLGGLTNPAQPYQNSQWKAFGMTAKKESMSASNTFGISTWTAGQGIRIYNISYAGMELDGAVNILANTPGGSAAGGKLTMQMHYSGQIPDGSSLVWMQVAYKIYSDHTDSRVPDTASNYPYISGTHVMDDVPKLPWRTEAADFVAYTFLGLKSSTGIAIYDNAIKWGFTVSSLE